MCWDPTSVLLSEGAWEVIFCLYGCWVEVWIVMERGITEGK